MYKLIFLFIIYMGIGIYLSVTRATVELQEKCPTDARQEAGIIAELTVYGRQEEIAAECQQVNYGLNGGTLLRTIPDAALWLPYRLGLVEEKELIEVEE